MSAFSSSCVPRALPIRVLIADRDYMGSQLLVESLNRLSVFEAFTVSAVNAVGEILAAVRTREPEIVVLSADFEGASKKGLQAARSVHANYSGVRIVILLDKTRRESVIAAFHCGARAVFCRNSPMSDFHACIERVSKGEIWAGSDETEFLLQAISSSPSCDGMDDERLKTLSKREIEVAERAAQGYSNRQIAEYFQLSNHTVKNYLSRIFEKLGVSNRIELLFLLFSQSRRPQAESADGHATQNLTNKHPGIYRQPLSSQLTNRRAV